MRLITTTAVAAISTVFVANIQAADADWDTTIAFGATLTSGNSETLTSTLSAEAVRKGTPNELRASASMNYGQVKQDDNTETTVQNIGAATDYKRVYDSGIYAGVDASLAHDDIADVDYRFVLGPSLGKYVLRNETSTLYMDLGIAFTSERVGGTDDEGALLTVRERLEHKLSDTAKLWQSAEVLPELDALDNLLISAEIGVEAALTGNMSLRLILNDKYDSEPAQGVDENDLSLVASVGLKI